METAFDAAMQIVNDFKNANASIRNTMYAALPASIKNKVVSAISSALSLTVSMATDMAKAMTLESAASTVFGNHTTKLDTFNDYWDGRGTVTESETLALMQAELNQHGKIGVQAYSLMGAFHRLEYAAGVYNLQVQAWNKHATSQTLDEKTVTDPVKPGFTTIGCFNHCGDFFNTFSDAESSHKEPCGTARNVDEMVADQYWNEMLAAFEPNEGQILAGRNVLAGCGRHYYDCPSVPDTEHEPQTCSVSGCTVQYRNCLRHTKDHSNHSGEEGSTEEQYVAPDPAPTPTPSYHTCGVHETWQSGDHSAASCGTSGHYVCDGSDHSLQASCLVTNANGDYCTVTSFYACQYHTHVYPAPPPTPSATCARSACGQTVSDRLAHRIDCGPCNGHYWTCISGAADNHRLKTCRFTECGQTWYACGTRPSCQKPWRQRNGLGCWAQ